MGMFSKKTPRVKPDHDSILGSVFSTANLMLGRVYEMEKEANSFDTDEALVFIGEPAIATWIVLQKAIGPLFSTDDRHEFTLLLATSQQLSPDLRKPFSKLLLPRTTSTLENSAELGEVHRALLFILSSASHKSGVAALGDRSYGMPEKLAYVAADYALRFAGKWIPCYLNDFSENWNIEKSCTRELPHNWEEESESWKTNTLENEIFVTTMALSLSTFIFDPIRARRCCRFS